MHWVAHRDGPARALAATPGVRARLPRVLGDTGEVVWVTDTGEGDALEISAAAGAEQPASRRTLAAGRLGRVEELAAAPDGKTVAVAAHDGRLLLVDIAAGDVADSPPASTVRRRTCRSRPTRPGSPGRTRAPSGSRGSASPAWRTARSPA